jgi:cell division protein FtsI (penicillin-binding protein 3)
VIKDRLGRVVEAWARQTPPVDGRDMQLSIDSKVQFFAYQKLRDRCSAHKAKAGSVVVLDAHTGEVLALANYPSYAPDKRQNLTGEQLRNRALTDTFEPGSTMKPFTMAGAGDRARAAPTPSSTPRRALTITGSTISDTHNYGALTVEGVIQKSSNVGTTKIAMQMPAREMWETFSAAGFGQKPQTRLPRRGERPPAPYKTWRPSSRPPCPMATACRPACSRWRVPTPCSRTTGDHSRPPCSRSTEPAVGVPVFSSARARQVRKMLQMAAGPAARARRRRPWATRWAASPAPRASRWARATPAGKYRAWFTGMAPIDKPRIIVAVMIDEPSNGRYYGGAVAAPVFSEVVQQTLRMMGVQPDMAVKPQIVADAVEESF